MAEAGWSGAVRGVVWCGVVRERENDVSGFAYSEPVMEKLLVGDLSPNSYSSPTDY